MILRITSMGNLDGTESLLREASQINETLMSILQKYGQKGVNALKQATPVRTGRTANSWGYSIDKNSKGITLSWTNSNISDGVPIAILIQYGHGTRQGGYVEGRDYINPVIRPIFDEIVREVTRWDKHPIISGIKYR